MGLKIKEPLRVKQKVASRVSGKPTIRNMADQLNMSTRTVTKIFKGRVIDWSTASDVAKFIGEDVAAIASEVS